MTLALRSCILIQRKICFQKFSLQRCTITSLPFNICNNKIVASSLKVKYFHTEGKNEEDKQLIHTGNLKQKLFHIKAFSLTTTCATLFTFPYICYKNLSEDISAMGWFTITLAVCYTMSTPILIHYIMGRKYATNIYFNSRKNSYIVERHSMFLKKIETEFTEDDVHVPDIAGPFTTCFVKGKPLFFNESDFTDLVHYHKIMGHYKPIDFLYIDKDKVKNVQNDKKK